MKTTLFDSLSKVLEKFNSSNFIQMTWFGLDNITSDDLKAFSDYFGLEPERSVYGDWDVLMFKKGGKRLDINDYAKMRRHVYDLIDDLQQQLVKQTPKKEVELKYGDYGWLDPKGFYYDSNWGSHQTAAKELVEELGLKEDYRIQRESEHNLLYSDYLSKYKNFVLIHSPSRGIPYPTILPGKKLTKKQKEFLYDFYMERNCPSLAYKYFNEEED